MPKIEIVCLANSRKLAGRCVAGIRTDGGGWVRPVSSVSGGALSLAQATLDAGRLTQHLDVVEIGVLRAVPVNHQPENWLIDNTTWRRTGRLDAGSVEDLLPRNGSVDAPLLGSASDRILKSDLDEHPIPRSLVAVTPNHVTWVRTKSSSGRLQVRARFEWHGDYDLAVTDPLWESRFAERTENEYGNEQIGLDPDERTLLTISLGEPMASGNCFKLVAGVVVHAVADDRSPTLGSTLTEIGKSRFGAPFDRPGRFKQEGWIYEGAREWPCPTCGGDLHVARKPYESAGKVYRYWALMCPRCRSVWAPQDLEPELRQLIYRSSPGPSLSDRAHTGAPGPPESLQLTSPSANERPAKARCSHSSRESCDQCGKRRPARGEKAFEENKRRILSGETFRSRKASSWSRRTRRRK